MNELGMAVIATIYIIAAVISGIDYADKIPKNDKRRRARLILLFPIVVIFVPVFYFGYITSGKMFELFKDAFGKETKTEQEETEKLLCVIITLNPVDGKVFDGEGIIPSDFSSRTEWREHLIAKKKEHQYNETGKTVDILENIGIQVRGHQMSSTIVAYGTAEQLIASLSVPGVQHISGNKPISIEEPIKE
jgi:hypothetical protein